MSKTSDSAAQTRQYVIFEIGSERYAVDILCIQEIRVWEKPTRLPNSPVYVKGVINLRGEIVPIVDLREHFLGSPSEPGPRTVVLVLLSRAGGHERVVGAIVDAVTDVCQMSPETFQRPPQFATSATQELIVALAALEGQLVMILDVDRLLETNPTAQNGAPKQS